MGVPEDFEHFGGPEMRSSTFAVGDHYWRILCYPNGRWHEDHISLFIEHDDVRHASQEIIGDTMAKIQFSILDQGLKPSYTKTTILQPIHGSREWDGFESFITHEDFDKEREKHLKDDCLTILCDLTVVVTGTDERMEIPPVAPPFDLHGLLAEAIWNKESPDVKIKVGGETFPAHRWILEARSPVFKADLSAASSRRCKYDYDSAAQLLHVRDMDPQVFKALLQFIYTDSPPETSLLEAPETAEMLLMAADRYELEKLKLFCEEALCPHIDMSSVSHTLALAQRHRCPVLKEACMRFLSSPANLETVMAMHGFEQLKKDCSSALLDLVVKKMMRQEK
ncbi:BTB/POZ and MATH domain-containing protein 3-like [Aegilops tauschii subsp. strangulata]|uniref:Speckle-type POZ protein-like protein n=1 Tax=Aegilops tauschii TaxID=37682 RepID=M8CPI0_AEGTA|nr:BTB/POZ and MATH domain-containing protein 3-like [Aegilops tauschii subsp. strangulata]